MFEVQRIPDPPQQTEPSRERSRTAEVAVLLLVALFGGACGSGIGVVPRPLGELVGLETPAPNLTLDRHWTRPLAAAEPHTNARPAAKPRKPVAATTQAFSPASDEGASTDVAAEAEAAFVYGLRAETVGANADAEAWYLWAAALSWDALWTPAASPTSNDLYNRAVGRYVELAFASDDGLVNRYAATSRGSVAVRLDRARSDLEPDDLQTVLDAGTLEVHGMQRRYTRSGLGAALITVRNPSGDPLDNFRPAAGQAAPATALLVFDPPSRRSSRSARLLLLDPSQRRSVVDHGRSLPVAADFTAPLAYLAESVDPSTGLIRPDQVLPRKGLVLLEPYSPDKTPVLMIHGLRSNPLIWMDLTNDLMGDDTLRDAYQVWHFSYPTGLPFLYAAFVLRDQLEELCYTLALETGLDLNANPAVVIGHSMGGLVAKAIAIDSGDVLWRTVFPHPDAELAGSRHDLELARQTLILEPSPLVSRIVYLATPHRGSSLADSLVGRLGSALAGRPDELAEAWRHLAQANAPSIAAPLLSQLRHGGPTSIRALSPEDPLLTSFAHLEPPATVPYHSIIGNQSGDPTAPDSDGIVTYASAHLADAASEAVVSGSHSLYQDPDAIVEVKRILMQHLLQCRSGQPSPQVAGLAPRP